MRAAYAVLFTCLVCSTAVRAQKKAVTETGQQVILYDEGTWKYESDSTADPADTSTVLMNPKKFVKSESATFLVKSTKVAPISFWVNPKKWSFEKGTGGDREYTLQLKGEDLYAMLITERIVIPLESLKKAAIQNALQAAPDAQVLHADYRMVNGLKMLCMQMKGTVQSIKFVYFGYYYSDGHGTVQFTAYTSESLWNSYRESATELLNGLMEP
jgi:hypothetical protein